MKASKHDLVVIGAGPGGYVAAIRAAQLGLNVACVEKEPSLGGTCLRIGCIPSKALLESSHHYEISKSVLKKHGVEVSGVSLNLKTMLRRKTQVVTTLSKGIEGLFKKNKITLYSGTARLDGPGRVAVQSRKESLRLESGAILIATGSQPTFLPGMKPDGEWVGSSTEALSYTEVPGHLVVIGAGYIGLELGSVWNRLGSKVTVLEYLDRILPGLDSDLSNDAHKMFEKQGLQFELGVKVTSAQRKGSKVLVQRQDGDPVTCDRVLVAVGRRPNTEGLGLETVQVETDDKGRIPVDAGFATSAKGVYAIGDVVAGPMLAHKAEEEGVAFAEGLVQGRGHVNYEVIPSVVYTHPEIASVGQTEEALRESKVAYRKGVFPFRANGRAHTLGEVEGKVKILSDERTDRILGVHILGPHAGDLINEAAMAMNFGASSEDLARTCQAHPTLAESMKEAALEVDGRAIHL